MILPLQMHIYQKLKLLVAEILSRLNCLAGVNNVQSQKPNSVKKQLMVGGINLYLSVKDFASVMFAR